MPESGRLPDLLPSLDEIAAAARVVSRHAIVTPVVTVDVDGAQTVVKLESLQPTGSFKIRGASASVAAHGDDRSPLITVSAGNMGKAVSYLASRLGRPCRVIVPDHAPAAKLDAIRAYGATIDKVDFQSWWELVREPDPTRFDGVFVHPFADRHVIAGNATIGRELAEQAEFDVVLVPWGGGGLSLGIALGLRETRPDVEVFAVEVATAAPLAASLAAGRRVTVPYEATFVDGIGAPEVSERIWPYVRDHIAGSIVVTPEAAGAAVRLAVEKAHVVIEGAAACAIAAARDPRIAGKRTAVIASGASIDVHVLAGFLA